VTPEEAKEALKELGPGDRVRVRYSEKDQTRALKSIQIIKKKEQPPAP
jgi:hypothetical protein